MHKVYILYSAGIDKYYIGQTANIQSRLKFHNDAARNKIWIRRGIPWLLKLTLSLTNRTEALRLEKHFKSFKSREVIESIIQSRTVVFAQKLIEADPE